MTTLVSQAEYARMRGVSRPAITQWKKRGWLVFEDGLVDVEASNEMLRRYRVGGVPDAQPTPEDVKPGAVMPRLNNRPVCLTRREIRERLKKLDYTQEFDWSDEAQDERAVMAARCVGLEAVQSPVRDDGHWGGFQLRDVERIQTHGLDEDAIVGGFGFEMYPVEVLRDCRAEVKPMDEEDAESKVMVRLDLLHLLAYPFSEGQKPE